MYNIAAMIKLASLVFLFLSGIALILSEPIDNDDLYTLVLSKIVGVGALHLSYHVFKGSLNRLNE
jgi:hypothetical protein